MVKSGIKELDASPSDEGDWMLVKSRELKNHYVHKCLFPQLVADLEGRGYPVLDSTPTRVARYEMPVFIYFMNRPEEKVKIDVLEITVPSRDVEIAKEILLGLKQRKFHDGTAYYKLKGLNTCIVLTFDQRSGLIFALQSLIDRANKREDEFFNNFMKKEDK